MRAGDCSETRKVSTIKPILFINFLTAFFAGAYSNRGSGAWWTSECGDAVICAKSGRGDGDGVGGGVFCFYLLEVCGEGAGFVIDSIQKGSLAVLLWFGVYVLAWEWIVDIVWPPRAKLAAMLSGKYGIDGPPPLPLIAWFAIFAIPTMVVGSLVFLYWIDTRK